MQRTISSSYAEPLVLKKRAHSMYTRYRRSVRVDRYMYSCVYTPFSCNVLLLRIIIFRLSRFAARLESQRARTHTHTHTRSPRKDWETLNVVQTSGARRRKTQRGSQARERTETGGPAYKVRPGVRMNVRLVGRAELPQLCLHLTRESPSGCSIYVCIYLYELLRRTKKKKVHARARSLFAGFHSI